MGLWIACLVFPTFPPSSGPNAGDRTIDTDNENPFEPFSHLDRRRIFPFLAGQVRWNGTPPHFLERTSVSRRTSCVEATDTLSYYIGPSKTSRGIFALATVRARWGAQGRRSGAGTSWSHVQAPKIKIHRNISTWLFRERETSTVQEKRHHHHIPHDTAQLNSNDLLFVRY